LKKSPVSPSYSIQVDKPMLPRVAFVRQVSRSITVFTEVRKSLPCLFSGGSEKPHGSATPQFSGAKYQNHRWRQSNQGPYPQGRQFGFKPQLSSHGVCTQSLAGLSTVQPKALTFSVTIVDHFLCPGFSVSRPLLSYPWLCKRVEPNRAVRPRNFRVCVIS
jgi:hypothetical protein